RPAARAKRRGLERARRDRGGALLARRSHEVKIPGAERHGEIVAMRTRVRDPSPSIVLAAAPQRLRERGAHVRHVHQRRLVRDLHRHPLSYLLAQPGELRRALRDPRAPLLHKNGAVLRERGLPPSSVLRFLPVRSTPMPTRWTVVPSDSAAI